jgi:hypothetical protein
MRRGTIAWSALLFGIVLGAVAAVFYAWNINPPILTNVQPWQLSQQGRVNYMIAVSLSYAKDRDLRRAAERLGALGYAEKTWQVLADTSCELARTSFASTNTGLTAIRSMVELYQSQRVVGCAPTVLALNTETPVPIPTPIRPTPTLIPPPTKTPFPTLGATFTPATQVPLDLSPTPAGEFSVVGTDALCDPKNPGMINIFVQDSDGTGLPGIPIEVTPSNESPEIFFTGLKAERDPGFADYQMTSGGVYTVTLPGLGERSRALQANTCNVAQANGGGRSATSYRITFRRGAAR